MIVRTTNGHPSLTQDGKVRACCCGCVDVVFEIWLGYTNGNITGVQGDHTITAVLSDAATKCGRLSFSLTKPLASELLATNVAERSCEGPCGHASLSKIGSIIGRVRFPATEIGTPVLVQYSTTRTFEATMNPSFTLGFGAISVSGLSAAGRRLFARYRSTGHFPGTRDWINVATDGTYGRDANGYQVQEGGTDIQHSDIFAEMYFA